MVMFAVPLVTGEKRTRKVVKPAILNRHAPTDVVVVAIVEVPTWLPWIAYHVVPLSGDASKLSVPTKVPRICTRAVQRPPGKTILVASLLSVMVPVADVSVPAPVTLRLPAASSSSACPAPLGSSPPTREDPSLFINAMRDSPVRR